MSEIKVMIVDDHHLVREGLKAVLNQVIDINVVGEAGTAEDALNMVEKLDPDVVLMDIIMPGMGGIRATKSIRERYPEVKVVILTMLDQEGYVYEAVKAGATGYMLKSASSDELVRAIKAVYDGKALLHPEAPCRRIPPLWRGPAHPTTRSSTCNQWLRLLRPRRHSPPGRAS